MTVGTTDAPVPDDGTRVRLKPIDPPAAEAWPRCSLCSARSPDTAPVAQATSDYYGSVVSHRSIRSATQRLPRSMSTTARSSASELVRSTQDRAGVADVAIVAVDELQVMAVGTAPATHSGQRASANDVGTLTATTPWKNPLGTRHVAKPEHPRPSVTRSSTCSSSAAERQPSLPQPKGSRHDLPATEHHARAREGE